MKGLTYHKLAVFWIEFLLCDAAVGKGSNAHAKSNVYPSKSMHSKVQQLGNFNMKLLPFQHVNELHLFLKCLKKLISLLLESSVGSTNFSISNLIFLFLPVSWAFSFLSYNLNFSSSSRARFSLASLFAVSCLTIWKFYSFLMIFKFLDSLLQLKIFSL